MEQTATDITFPVRYDKNLDDILDANNWLIIESHGERVAEIINQHATLLTENAELKAKLEEAENATAMAKERRKIAIELVNIYNASPIDRTARIKEYIDKLWQEYGPIEETDDYD